MKRLPYDLVADWQPERESLLPTLAKDLASLAAVVAFCGLFGSVAIFFA